MALGYFEVIDRRPLAAGDVLANHCFRSLSPRFGKYQYFDDAGRELDQPAEPCGDWGLNSYRTVDDELSDALGFEKVPD